MEGVLSPNSTFTCCIGRCESSHVGPIHALSHHCLSHLGNASSSTNSQVRRANKEVRPKTNAVLSHSSPFSLLQSGDRRLARLPDFCAWSGGFSRVPFALISPKRVGTRPHHQVVPSSLGDRQSSTHKITLFLLSHRLDFFPPRSGQIEGI